MPTNVFRAVIGAFMNGEIDWDSNDIKVMLLGAGYTPNFDTHDYLDDIVANEIAAGGGYSAGGSALAGKARTFTVANSWANAWAAGTTYEAGYIVRPTTGNGFVYMAQGAGASHAVTEPTWPTTIGDEVVDNGVTWTCVGKGVLALTATSPVTWATSNITARYAVIYNNTPGTNGTKNVILCIDKGSAITSTDSDFKVNLPAQGCLLFAIP